MKTRTFRLFRGEGDAAELMATVVADEAGHVVESTLADGVAISQDPEPGRKLRTFRVTAEKLRVVVAIRDGDVVDVAVDNDSKATNYTMAIDPPPGQALTEWAFDPRVQRGH